MVPHPHLAGAVCAGILALCASTHLHAQGSQSADTPRFVRTVIVPHVQGLTLSAQLQEKFAAFQNEIAAHPAVADRIKIAQRAELTGDTNLLIKVLAEAVRGLSEEDADSFERTWSHVSRMFVATAVQSASTGSSPGGGGTRTVPQPGARPTESEQFKFPWPPPRPLAKDIFRAGGQLDRNWLGNDDTPLNDVQSRLRNALEAAAEGFESGIFPIPTGVAIVTRYERIKADGQPLPGAARWPGNSQLAAKWPSWMFVDKPGFYRKIVFAITTEDELTWGEPNSLPEPLEGRQTLPPDLREKKFKDYQIHVLVYTFESRGRDSTPKETVSVFEHVKKAGLVAKLAPRRNL